MTVASSSPPAGPGIPSSAGPAALGTASGRSHGASHRIGELDALRGLAALAVVLFHYIDRFDELHDHTTEPLFFLPWGARGVQLFFVISGFVIFMTLSRTRRPADFIVSRFSRLFPGYWVAILVTTATVQLAGMDYYIRPMRDVVVNFTMLQTLPFVPGQDIEGAYWTLYVELWFYVVMLVLFSLGLLRRIEWFLIAGLVASLVWAAGIAWRGEMAWGWNLTQTFKLVLPQLPFFVIGICLYRIHVGAHPGRAWLIILAALATVAVQLPLEFLGAALVSLLAFGLVLSGRAGFLRQPVLIWLGAISYSLYLVHNFAGRSLMLRMQAEGWDASLSLVLVLALALGTATLLTWLVERPAQRLIRRAYGSYRRWADGPGKPPAGPVLGRPT